MSEYRKLFVEIAEKAAVEAGKNAGVAPQLLLADIIFALADREDDLKRELGAAAVPCIPTHHRDMNKFVIPERYPSSDEEHDPAHDPIGEHLSRGIKRLRFAYVFADPRAPDQMALVWRRDAGSLLNDYTRLKAYCDCLKESEAKFQTEISDLREREATLTALLTEAVEIFEGMRDDEIDLDFIPKARAALQSVRTKSKGATFADGMRRAAQICREVGNQLHFESSDAACAGCAFYIEDQIQQSAQTDGE